MNLHRTSSKPDWEHVSSSSRTPIQNVAAMTRGIISPANIITVIGLAIVIYGLAMILENHFWLGFVLLVTGRLLDILDGVVAEATRTKSPLGEMVDAVADKVGTLLTVVVLFLANLASWWVIVALLAPQVLIPIVIFYKKHKGIGVHPTRAGKVSMALAWVGIVGLVVVKALNDTGIVALSVYAVIGGSLLLGLYALWQYATGRD